MRIGIDLGGTNIAGGVLNDSGELLCAKSIPTDAQRPYSEVIHDMGLLAVELAQMAGTSIDSVESVGVGSPGTPHKETGNILYSNNLGWENVPLVQELGDTFRCQFGWITTPTVPPWANTRRGQPRDAGQRLWLPLAQVSAAELYWMAKSIPALILLGERSATWSSSPVAYAVPAGERAAGNPMRPRQP